MATRHFFAGRGVSTSLILFIAVALVRAATLTVPLSVPQLQQLTAQVEVEGEGVEVNLGFVYGVNGRITLTPESTVDGLPVIGKATVKNQAGVVSFTVSAASTTKPRTAVTFKGVLGTGLARATYSGPRGRVTILDQAVEVVSADAIAQADFIAATGNRGKLSGAGTITAYDLTPATTSKLTGTITGSKLSFSLKQGNRVITFKGVPSGADYVGTLKATVPPSRTTITPFSVPASAFIPPNTAAAFQGTVLLASNAAPTAAVGVAVTLKSDFDGNAEITDGESATVTTDENGRYNAEFNVQEGVPVILEISQPGFAKYMTVFRTVTVGATVSKNATLQLLNSLPLSNGAAESSDGKLMMTGLPTAISNVSARIFNPNTETAQFPGEFADSDGNLLVSSVFAAIEATDGSGAAVTDLGTNAVLFMEVPADTWSTMGDLTPGNGQIDVPLYYFDENTGEWKRSLPDGWLETTGRVVIAESQLASIQNGTYAGRVYSVGRVAHLSYWNVDWPIDTHACLQAVIVDESGTPVQGASVTVRGTTYTGSTSPALTGADGAFCADIMRSEGAAEDVDRDGTLGETHQMQVTVRFGTNVYSFGPFSSPQTQGTCESGGCANLGNLVLSETNRLALTICTISGRMTYSGNTLFGTPSSLQPGDPIAGAIVYAIDEEAPDAAYECLGSGACTVFATTAADGSFTITTPVLSGVNVYGYKTGGDDSGYDYYFGSTFVENCPSGQVAVAADYWSVRYIVLSLAGNNVESGAATFYNGQLTLSVTASNGVNYLATQPDAGTRPTATGPWFTVPLMRITNTGLSSAGTVSFTVTSVTPLAGTWTTSTAGLSGTFTDEAAPPAEADASVRIEAQRRVLEGRESSATNLSRILPPTRYTPPPPSPAAPPVPIQ